MGMVRAKLLGDFTFILIKRCPNWKTKVTFFTTFKVEKAKVVLFLQFGHYLHPKLQKWARKFPVQLLIWWSCPYLGGRWFTSRVMGPGPVGRFVSVRSGSCAAMTWPQGTNLLQIMHLFLLMMVSFCLVWGKWTLPSTWSGCCIRSSGNSEWDKKWP